MTSYWLKIDCLSDAAFGRGDGVAGVVDAELQHDKEGFVFMSGKTLKGLLSASCAELMHALIAAGQSQKWEKIASNMFGDPGHVEAHMGNLHVGDARLPESLRTVGGKMSRIDRLESLTTIRTQTAIDPVTGAPMDHSLRSIRVILRGTSFVSRLEHDLWDTSSAKEDELALLAAVVKGLRRAGTSRNRGLGKIKVELFDADPFSKDVKPITDSLFKSFSTEVLST